MICPENPETGGNVAWGAVSQLFVVCVRGMLVSSARRDLSPSVYVSRVFRREEYEGKCTVPRDFTKDPAIR